jgi:hypothetical protein
MVEYEQSSKLFLQKGLNALREILGPDVIASQTGFFIKAGQASAVLGGLIGLLIGVVGAVKTDSFALFGAGIGWVVLTIFFYYAGAVTLAACDDAIKNSPTQISSFRILDALASLVGLVIIATAVGALYAVVKFENFEILKYVVPILISIFYFMYLLLFPAEISTTEVSTTSAGNDALALFSVLAKASLRLVPITFGSLTIVGTFILGYILYGFFGENGTYKIMELVGSGIEALLGVSIFIYGLLYPLISYIIFVAFFLAIDIARNILIIGTIDGRLASLPNGDIASRMPDETKESASYSSTRVFHVSANASSGETRVVSESELHELFRAGQIDSQTLIWTEGLADWVTYGEYFR